MTFGLLDFVGTVGVVLLMLTYLLLQLNKLESSGIAYSLLNAVGAFFIILSLWANFNLSAFVIEAFWVLISLVGIVRYLRLKTASS